MLFKLAHAFATPTKLDRLPARVSLRASAEQLESRLLLAGNEFFAAVTGTPSGDGSISSPWDLSTALSQTANVLPGDTLWIRGGTYYGGYQSNLTGTSAEPITVAAYQDEHVTIDTYDGITNQ